MGTGELLGKPNCEGVTCDGLASRPGEAEILLAASCYRNRDRLRQLWASLGSKASLTSTILSLRKVHELKELNILSRTEVASSVYQPQRTIRVASEIPLRMNPTLRYFLSLTLKLASNQPHTSSSNWCQGSHSKIKRNPIGFMSKIWFWPWRLPQGDQSFPQHFNNCYLKVHNYDSSRWLRLERFSSFLTKVEYPSSSRHSLS